MRRNGILARLVSVMLAVGRGEFGDGHDSTECRCLDLLVQSGDLGGAARSHAELHLPLLPRQPVLGGQRRPVPVPHVPAALLVGVGTAFKLNTSLSVAAAPVYSNGNTTVTVTLKNWKWSDGETVTAQDVLFFMNIYHAQEANFCGYVPGDMPDDVKNVTANGQTVTFTLSRSSTRTGGPTTRCPRSPRCRWRGT